MADLQALRNRIHGATAPLPTYFKDDCSVDYAAIERYVNWLIGRGIRCLCLTHGYSQLGYVSEAELLELTRLFADAAKGRAVFFSSTRGAEDLTDVVRVVEEQAAAGADGVFIVPPRVASSSMWYTRVLCNVAAETDVPILAMYYGGPTRQPILSMDDMDRIVEHENFIGLKEDVNEVSARLKLTDRYGDRLAIIGGGVPGNYLHFHHYPCQSELDGFWSPGRTLGFVEALDAGDLRRALAWAEDWERVHGRLCAESPEEVQGGALYQVIAHTLGCAGSYQVRPPLVTATPAQAEKIAAYVREHAEVYEPCDG